MSTTLVLVRHGQTVHNAEGRITGWTDSPLSEAGLAQAASVARHVAARYALDRVYSSPLRRARDTAEAIARLAGLRPILRDGLKEINFGRFENLTKAEILDLYPEAAASWRAPADPSFTYPEGESLRDFFDRVIGAFREIVKESLGLTVAVVAHGGVLGSYLAHVFEGQPLLWRKYIPRNCAVTEIHAADGRLSVICFNDWAFLGAAEVDLKPPETEKPATSAADG